MPALLQRCEAAMQQALGAQATAVRSQSYYLDVTPPGCDKGTFVRGDGQAPRHFDRRGRHHRRHAERSGDVQKSGISFAMGNATDDVKQQATHVTASNEDEGFAAAMEVILKNNATG